MNYWAGAIILFTAIAGIAGYQLYSAAQKISTDISGRMSLDFSGVVFTINVKIKNPTNIKLYILKPYVSVVYKGSEIAKSEPDDEITLIPPFAPAQLITIKLSAKYFDLTGVGLELMKKLQDKKTKVTITANIHVTAVVGLKGNIPKRLKDYKSIYKTIALPVITKDIQI